MARTKAPARAIPTSSATFVFVMDVDTVAKGVEVVSPCRSPTAATTGVSGCWVADGIAAEVRNVLAAGGGGRCICGATAAEVETAIDGVDEDCCICEATIVEAGGVLDGVCTKEEALVGPMILT